MIYRLLAVSLLLLLPTAAEAAPPAWANYTVTFEATWSADTHPESFPGNPHFSGLVGGTHDAEVEFWAPGALASTGIKQMAEWGSKTVLIDEVNAAIGAGHAAAVLSGGGIGVSPGQVALGFSVGPDHPLVTLVTMIAPSPDWFAGVRGLDLLDGDQWRPEVVVTLYPYDAGTDSGVSYTSSDLVTNPPVPIDAITGSPFTPGEPIGTMTFRLDAAAAAGPPAAPVALTAVPNPFNPSTELRYTVPAGARSVSLAVHDVRGRLVRRLPAVTAAGDHRSRWDGQTEAGLAAASGTYFARLAIDGQSATHKLTLLK